jgi:hypothetical protein
MAEAVTNSGVSPSPSPPSDNPGFGGTYIKQGTYKGCQRLHNHEQICVNTYVMQQQVGRTYDYILPSCGGLEPVELQRCVNNWITSNLQGTTCGTESSAGYQRCLNGLVDAKMQAPTSSPLSFDGDILAGTYGGCSKLHSAHQQDCINTWADKQQVGIEYDAIYPTCDTSFSDADKYQECVNQWILNTYVQPPAQPGEAQRVGGCMFAPTGDTKEDNRQRQECLNQVGSELP